jgi:long-subunit acyl-CoA synthetase (AMP-forming)
MGHCDHSLSPCNSPVGEYVAVEFIESTLGKCEYVEQVWVYGSSYESVLVAVVVPKQPALLSWAKEQVRAEAGAVAVAVAGAVAVAVAPCGLNSDLECTLHMCCA